MTLNTKYILIFQTLTISIKQFNWEKKKAFRVNLKMWEEISLKYVRWKFVDYLIFTPKNYKQFIHRS